MTQYSWIPCTGFCAIVFIDTKLQTQRMNKISQCSNATRETVMIGLQCTILHQSVLYVSEDLHQTYCRTTMIQPAIIDDDILISSSQISTINHQLCLFSNQFLATINQYTISYDVEGFTQCMCLDLLDNQ